MIADVSVYPDQHVSEKRGDSWWHLPRAIPLQFTGLKDRNNVPIFESDIVRVVYDGSLEGAGGDDEVREVVWGAKEDEYYPAFDLKGNDMETNALSVAKNNGDIEVIGNVWENPELLTV
jgi:uncharacterized phage protein (TIGR01671 family)